MQLFCIGSCTPVVGNQCTSSGRNGCDKFELIDKSLNMILSGNQSNGILL